MDGEEDGEVEDAEVSLVELEKQVVVVVVEVVVVPRGDGGTELLLEAEDQSSSDIFLEFGAEGRT